MLPEGVLAVTISTERGDFAAHESRPAGRPRGHVLMIPGWTGSKEDFTPLLPVLAAQGWHAVAYDQRGQYETRGRTGDDYTLEGFAADALAVRADSGTSTSHLLGHSFGGLVAQTAVLADETAWQSLSLLCTGPGALGESSSRPLGAFATAIDQVGLAKLHELRESIAGAERPLDIARFLAKRFVSNTPASLKAITLLLLRSDDRIEEVAAAQIPVWVGRGARDDAWPHDIQTKMAERLGVEMVVIDNSAHSPAIENTEQTAALLGSFFDTASSPSP